MTLNIVGNGFIDSHIQKALGSVTVGLGHGVIDVHHPYLGILFLPKGLLKRDGTANRAPGDQGDKQ
jgi:hypothetical protein